MSKSRRPCGGEVCCWILLAFAPAAVRAAESDGAWEWSLSLKTEAVRTEVAGGAGESSFLGSLDLLTYFDAAKAWGWTGWRLHFHLLGTTGAGTPPSEVAGDFQVSSNIEAPEDFKVYELWGERTSADGRWSALFGLFDYNFEFARLDSGAPFHLSSFGIAPDISQNGPTIFPTTGLALRLRYQPSPRFAVRALVADGLPGSRRGRRGTHFEWHEDDGLFSTVEVEWKPRRVPSATLRTGLWNTTAPGYDYAEGRPERDNFGAYASWEATLRAGRAGRGPLTGFLQLGHADPERNAVHRYFGAGLLWSGPVAARPEDAIGLATARAEIGDARRRGEGGLPHHEIVLELFYRWALSPHWALEPDVQFIDQPAARADAPDAWRLALRVTADY